MLSRISNRWEQENNNNWAVPTEKSVHENHVYDFQSGEILKNLIKLKLPDRGNVQIIGPFVCPYCSKRYKFKSALADHINSDQEKYPIQ